MNDGADTFGAPVYFICGKIADGFTLFTFQKNVFKDCISFPLQPACSRPETKQLVTSLGEQMTDLDRRMHEDADRGLDERREKIEAAGPGDPTLTEQARNTTESIRK